MQYQHHMWLYFCHIWWSPYFFLTFDGSIVTLDSTNITLDCTFLTFNGSLFFLANYHNTSKIKKITEIPLEPKKWKKKITLKLKNYQNYYKTQNMTEIITNLKNDQNSLRTKKNYHVTLKLKKWLKLPQNLKND